MAHEGLRIFYDTTLVAYALSLTLFFSDVLQPRRFVNRTAVVLLFVAFLTLTGILFIRFHEAVAPSSYTKTDAMLFISWLMLVSTMVLDTFLRIGLVLFFTNLVGFGIVLFAGDFQTRVPTKLFPYGDLLFVHIGLAIVSEAIFAFAFSLALMHILQDSNLRHHRFNRWFLRLPSVAQLESSIYVATAVGFFLLFAAIVIGDAWGKLVLNEWVLFSPKPVVTILSWALYGAYIWLRKRGVTNSQWLMRMQLLCFAVTLFNLTLVGNVSLHHPQ